MKIDWAGIGKAFKDVGAEMVLFREEHPILVNNVGCFFLGLVVGFLIGRP